MAFPRDYKEALDVLDECQAERTVLLKGAAELRAERDALQKRCEDQQYLMTRDVAEIDIKTKRIAKLEAAIGECIRALARSSPVRKEEKYQVVDVLNRAREALKGKP